MLNILKACELVCKHSNSKYIGSIGETDECYLIGVLSNNGESLTQPAFIVDKTLGTVRSGSFGEFAKKYLGKLDSIKSVEIPEQYRYHGEIKY